jgi:PhzF family phenazine biosynthesis protein
MTADAPRPRGFAQVDVFTASALLGNPLAVVLDGRGLDDARMAAFARWTHLSETVFLLPPTHPEADYRVRIFTPGGELAFAGHPTLGACHAWLAAGGVARRADVVVQECAIGRVPIRRAPRLAFAAPPPVFERVDDALLGRVQAALGLDPARARDATWAEAGSRQLAVLVDSADAVLALRPDHAALKSLAKVGVVGPHRDGAECRFELRFFAAAAGIEEDPVTGSLNGMVAHWLIGSGRAPASYVAAQGTALGRAGRVHVLRDAEGTWIGGDVVPCVEGAVLL